MKNLLIRLTLCLFLLTALLNARTTKSQAISQEDCERKFTNNESISLEDAQACRDIFINKKQEATQQKESLKTEIKKLDVSIAITTSQIFATLVQIKQLEKEITDLTSKIGKLDISLDQLSEVLVKRIAATYKKGKIDPLALFLSSNGFTEFISRYKYLQVMQIHDRTLMIQMETARTSYDDQKKLKEQKQRELEAARKKLESQKTLLAQQKTSKEDLLRITQGSEQKFQQLYSRALAEVASLKGFTQKQGGGVLPPQNSPDGWFFSQRDERWASVQIGSSQENILDVGCLVASVAMIFTFYSQPATPADIAANSSYFFSNTAYMNRPWPSPSGKSQIELGSMTDVDSELDAGRPVIVHLNLGGDGHFVVLKRREGGDYIMHDPWQGYDKKFSDYYSISSIDKRVVYK